MAGAEILVIMGGATRYGPHRIPGTERRVPSASDLINDR